MNNFVAALAAACLVAAVPAAAQDTNAAAVAELNAMQKAAKADKRALVNEKLALTPAEAKKFWPVYDGCQREFAGIMRKRALALETLVARDRPLTDAYARDITNDLVTLDEAGVRAERKCTNATLKVLPARKAARYLQLENKLRVLQEYEIAVAFPLAQ